VVGFWDYAGINILELSDIGLADDLLCLQYDSFRSGTNDRLVLASEQT
jgi:hypothetical protein